MRVRNVQNSLPNSSGRRNSAECLGSLLFEHAGASGFWFLAFNFSSLICEFENPNHSLLLSNLKSRTRIKMALIWEKRLRIHFDRKQSNARLSRSKSNGLAGSQ